jgi:putative oxidoreductase
MSDTAASSFARWGLLPLRMVVGLVFLMHGGQKLLTFGLAGTTTMMTHMGVPLPQISAIVVTAAELLGGLALITGLFTRLAALALAVDMAFAVFLVKLPGGWFAPRGVEFELTLCAAALTLALVGAGTLSLDAARRRAGRVPPG